MKIKLLLLIIATAISCKAQGQIITTIAGNGTAGYSGDNGAATAAKINEPSGVTFDNTGNVYIVDRLNNRIRKVNTFGIITTIAGNGATVYINDTGSFGDNATATAAKLWDPFGVAVDGSGNVYIADELDQRIREVNTSGIITTVAGSGTSEYNNGFSGDSGAATTAKLYNPFGVAIYGSGNIYIADQQNNRIRKINTSGIITTIAGNGYNTGTGGGYSGDNAAATAAELGDPTGVAVDGSGNVYIADENNNRIRKIDTFGIITTIAGNGTSGYSGDNAAATAAEIAFPSGIAVDGSGNIYIADAGNNRIRMVNASGIITTIAGGGSGIFGNVGDNGPATAAELNNPTSIAIDGCGDIYIADYGNSRIRKITSTTGIPVITISPSGSDTVCTGTPVTITTTVTGSNNNIYKWLVNGVVVSAVGSTYTYTPINGDSVRCVFAGIGVCSGNLDTVSSNTINMVVTPLTVPTVSITGVTTAAVGSMVTLNATVANAGSSYDIKWYDNGVLFNTTTVPTVTYTKAAGTDVITATVIPISAGCYDSTTAAAHTVTIGNTGIANISTQAISVYPNPAHNAITITADKPINSVALINLLGQTVYNEQCNSTTIQVGMENLPVGIYFVKVDGVFVQKVVKE